MAGRDEREGQGHGSELENTRCDTSVCMQPGGQNVAHPTQMLSSPGEAACPGNGWRQVT